MVSHLACDGMLGPRLRIRKPNYSEEYHLHRMLGTKPSESSERDRSDLQRHFLLAGLYETFPTICQKRISLSPFSLQPLADVDVGHPRR